MAIIRETPKCILCGKPTHEAVYQDQSNLPPQMQVLGDTFLRWEPIEHECDGDILTSEKKKALSLFSVVKAKRTFSYCQREIEGNKACSEQCDHCKEYYAPLEGQ